MIAEDLIERGLTAAADDYDVPADAVDRLRAQLAPAVADDDPGSAPVWRSPSRWHMTSGAWLTSAAAAVALLIVVAFAVGGAGPNGDQGGSSGGGGGTALSPGSSAGFGKVPSENGQKSVTGAGTAGRAPVAGPVVPDVAVPEAPLPAPPRVQTRVVKTGELDLQVAKGRVGPTLDRLTAIATLERGYVSDSRTSEGGGAPSGQVTMRVPVAQFEEAVSRVRHIEGVKVLAATTSGEDVTARYVDLQSRIKALRLTRSTFLTLLSKATTIGETLAVQQHVTDVQTQIEQLQGQLKVLAGQSSMSTLTVTVDQKYAVAATKPHHKNGFVKAVELSVSRFVRGVEAIIGVIGPILLALILVALGWLAARVGYRSLRRRMV